MKEIRIKIYGWSDLKKWFWDSLCYPRRKLVAESLESYSENIRRPVIELLLKYNNKDIEKDGYAILSEALEYWDKKRKEICDETMKQIMMKIEE